MERIEAEIRRTGENESSKQNSPTPQAMSHPTSSTPKPMWRRLTQLFRFRLTTLFVAITLLAAWLAWRFHREPISLENVSQISRINEIPCPDIYQLVYSSDRQRVAFVGWEKPVDVREAITLWPLQTVGVDRKLINFAFGPDGRHLALSENSTRAEILLDGRTNFVLETGADQPDVVFSPDGKLLATGGYSTKAKLWDVETGRLVCELDCGPEIGGLTPAFSADGRIIAIGNRTSETVLFDVASGERLISLPERETQELAFHPSGHLLAVSYVDGSIRLWNPTTGQLIAKQQKVANEIYSLDWSPNGELLASSGLKGDICLWDEQLQLRHSLTAPEWVISVKFSPDGARLITAGGDAARGGARSVTVWGIPPTMPRLLTR
jgi:WD40 repeat protein